MGISIRQYRRFGSERVFRCGTPIGEKLSAVMMFCFAQSRYVSGAENIYLAEQISRGSRRFAKNIKAPEGRHVASKINLPTPNPPRAHHGTPTNTRPESKPRRGDT